MSDEEPAPAEKKAGLEFDYHLTDDGRMETAVVVRDASKVRSLVMAKFQWIPSVMPKTREDYPGFEELESRIESGQYGEPVNLPVLIIGHMPSHLPPEEAVEDIQHMLLLCDQQDVIAAIGSGVNMFAQDDDITAHVMHVFGHLLGNDDDDDDDQG
jgi:hypothetical protein